jgi:hypothetical protein
MEKVELASKARDMEIGNGVLVASAFSKLVSSAG